MSDFANTVERIDPQRVPFRTLAGGARIPVVGMGTFGSDSVRGEEVADAVRFAAKIGWRHFDCASVYGNETLIGDALRDVQKSGVVRRDLWITSKLWNDKHDEKDVAASCERSLKDLKLDYLDLYLVHWPFPNHHGPGVGVDSRDPHAVPYIHENYRKTWRQMERLVTRGLVRHIGTSNMSVPKLKLLLRDAAIRPVVNEMELHPHFQQPELFRFVTENGIVPIGFSPIGSPARPERDRTAGDTVDVEDPVLVRIAQNRNVHPAVVCVQWAVQRGQIPIPFSVKKRNLFANLQAAVAEPLTEEEMRAIAGIDRNCRLIKGQVFLWKSARSWEDLWDPDGRIAP